ncbi:MAG: NADH:flavin oxidoreductase [Syntrophales bacterium]|jgi:2,4-dienoyl-CoA reductase-like NADH-dependent reductase (Old Yellow Enzyme family)|nr:NADH:flavin oxidoreductase [Syntrophales bacterium]
MSILFTPAKIANMELENRFVRAATGDRFTEGTGFITDRKVAFYSNLAEGGAGLIITSIATVHPMGKTSVSHTSIAGDEYIPMLKKLVAAVHEWGAKIAIQIGHAGREASRYWNTVNRKSIGPSWIEGDPHFKGDYRTMTEEEIWEVIRAYGDGARRAREAGFDAVEIHAAHAYLPAQFLSSYSNRRTDQWGGPLENRLRFHREVYRDIREKSGGDYPLLLKLGVQDGFAGGLDLGEGVRAAVELERCGYDALEVSQGLRGRFYEETEFRTGIDSREKEAYFRGWASEVKKNVTVPVVMVGGLRTFELMEEVVRNGEADLVSLCRPFIREPGIVNEWKRGSRRRAACISCNKCLEAIRRGETLACIFNESTDEKA